MLPAPIQVEGPLGEDLVRAYKLIGIVGYTDINLEQLFQSQQQLLSLYAADTQKPVNETLWICELQLAAPKMMKSDEVVCQPSESRRKPKI